MVFHSACAQDVENSETGNAHLEQAWDTEIVTVPAGSTGETPLQALDEIRQKKYKSLSEDEKRLADAKQKELNETYREIVENKDEINPMKMFVPLTCTGVVQQGGLVKCKTIPKTKIRVSRGGSDHYVETADAKGELLIGFDRDEKLAEISVHASNLTTKPVRFEFEPREYDISRIDGLPPSQVSTFTEEQLKRIKASSARKKIGFASRTKEMGFKDGFIYPMTTFTKTSPFGAQRILNGEAKRPHYGVDIAAPLGTPIYAPADGIISLADDDLYFEGAMVMIDHGQGLNSMYLHVNEVLVEAGQNVKRGDQIATVGSKGRSTGPHLCWRLKWRNRNLDPELLTQWPGREQAAQ